MKTRQWYESVYSEARPLAEKMYQSSSGVGPEVDEFALVGMTPGKSEIVSVLLPESDRF